MDHYEKLQDAVNLLRKQNMMLEEYMTTIYLKDTTTEFRHAFAERYGYSSFKKASSSCYNWKAKDVTKNRTEALAFLEKITFDDMTRLQERYAYAEPFHYFVPKGNVTLMNILKETIFDKRLQGIRRRKKQSLSYNKRKEKQAIIKPKPKPVVVEVKEKIPMFEDETNIPEPKGGTMNMSAGIYGSHRTTYGSSEDLL